MPVSINERIDAPLQLGAVDDRAPRDGVLLVDCVKRADEDFEWEFRFDEGADEGPEFGLSVDVFLDVFREEGGTLEVPLSAFGFGFLHEGYIPSVTKGLHDLICVKVALEGFFPDVDRKGGILEGLPKTVHVGSEASLGQSSADSIDVVGHDIGTRAP